MLNYNVMRMHFDDDIPNRIVKIGLSFTQAYDYCMLPEACSSLASHTTRTQERHKSGSTQWFDIYIEEDKSYA